MRGSTFLALFLILTGIVFLVATLRGRAPVLYDAIAESAGSGTRQGRPAPVSNRPPRKSIQ